MFLLQGQLLYYEHSFFFGVFLVVGLVFFLRNDCLKRISNFMNQLPTNSVAFEVKVVTQHKFPKIF